MSRDLNISPVAAAISLQSICGGMAGPSNFKMSSFFKNKLDKAIIFAAQLKG